MHTNTPLRNRVKELRERLNVRQSALAREVGITRQTIIAIEKGRLNPSILICLKIAKMLREPVDYIFYLEPGFDYAALAAANAGRPKRGRKKRVPLPDVSSVAASLAGAPAETNERHKPHRSEAEAEEVELVNSFPSTAEPHDASETDGKDPRGGQAIWDFF